MRGLNRESVRRIEARSIEKAVERALQEAWLSVHADDEQVELAPVPFEASVSGHFHPATGEWVPTGEITGATPAF